LTDRLCFQGRDQITALIEVILEVFEDLRYIEQSSVGDLAFLVARAQIEGHELEIVDLLRLGPGGRIEEMTVFFRPLPASAVALRLIGAGLARRKSRFRSALLSTLARPLGFMASTGDRVGVHLLETSI
jgi:hypothetical protein